MSAAPIDPNKTLARLRELCALDNVHLFSTEVANLVEALDRWLTEGGFLPTAWLPPMVAVEPGGSVISRDRARTRLMMTFARALGYDDEFDRRFGTDTHASSERTRLARLLAEAVLTELDEERRQLEAMMSSAITERYMAEATMEAMRARMEPQRLQLVQDGTFPGFTAEGTAKLLKAREGRDEPRGT